MIDIAKIASQTKRYETDFKELSKIGKGGFSKVYKVLNQVDDQLYAIKKVELKVRDIKDNFQVKLERVLREARYLARLSHPQIIRYYNSWVQVTEVQRSSKDTNIQSFSQNFSKKNKNNWESKDLNEITEKDQEIVFYFDSKNSNLESHESFNHGSMENLVEFNKCPSIHDDEVRDSPLIKHAVGPVMHKLQNRDQRPKKSLGDIERFQRQQSQNNEPISFSEFELSASNEEFNDDIEDVKRSKRLSKHKLHMKKSTSQECKNGDDKKKNSFLDQYEKIIIYIQTEICDKTLDHYITQRNQKLMKLKKGNQTAYDAAMDQYNKEAVLILRQIISGLEYIHKNRLIHRDLKPGNIFMNDNGEVKIGDFGLVKKIEKLLQHKEPKLTEVGTEFREASDNSSQNGHCTKLYASPEQIDCDNMKSYDHRMDIHALGLIILQLYHPMFTQMEILRKMQDARKGNLPSSISESVSKTIIKCLSKDPSSRPCLDEILFSLDESIISNQSGMSGSSTTTTKSIREKEILGKLKIQLDGSSVVKERYLIQIKDRLCVFYDRQLLIYKDPNDAKARYSYNVEECQITLDKELQISIVHPLQVCCMILLHDDKLASSLFKKLKFGCDWANHAHYFEND